MSKLYVHGYLSSISRAEELLVTGELVVSLTPLEKLLDGDGSPDIHCYSELDDSPMSAGAGALDWILIL